jgi:hypothetical protein
MMTRFAPQIAEGEPLVGVTRSLKLGAAVPAARTCDISAVLPRFKIPRARSTLRCIGLFYLDGRQRDEFLCQLSIDNRGAA